MLKPFALLLSLSAAPALAMTQDDVLQAGLLPGWRMEGGHHMAGLAFALAPGWKTYWRSPGEAGIPPQFDWSGSTNVQAVRVHWPSPVVFQINGMQTVGYKGGVVLPLEVVPVDPAKPVHLKARVDMGVCNDICLPAEVALSGDLPAAGGKDAEIQAALNNRPESGGQAGLSSITCAVEPIADGLRVTARIDLPARGGEETVIFENADATVWVSQSETSRNGASLTSVAEMVATSGTPFALDRSGVKVTVLGHGRAVEIDGCPAP